MKKFLCTALAAAIILSSFASCSTAVNDESAAEIMSVPTAETLVEESEPDKFDYAREKYAAIASADYEGADFGIASQAGVGNSEVEIWVEELTGDGVNDAVYNRNLSVNDTFNCNITLTPRRCEPASAPVGSGSGRFLQARFSRHGYCILAGTVRIYP